MAKKTEILNTEPKLSSLEIEALFFRTRNRATDKSQPSLSAAAFVGRNQKASFRLIFQPPVTHNSYIKL